MHHTALISLPILFVIALIALFFKAKAENESTKAEAEQVGSDFINDADKAKAVAVTDAEAVAKPVLAEGKKLDSDVVAVLHKAEDEGTLVAGTVQKYVDAHFETSPTPSAAVIAVAPTPDQP